HEEGTMESGLNGVRVNFDSEAIPGGTNNSQNGLSVVDGALTWTDLGGGPGAAISYHNGQEPWAGNDFSSRPHDNSNYNYAVFRVRATDLAGNTGTSVDVQGFSQTNLAYTYQTLGPDLTLPIDGQWHDLAFPLSAMANQADRIYSNNISINLQGHANDIKM